jgi:DNA-3-methyladenine glycosylase
LPQGFYARDALAVARDLLGKWLKRGRVVLRITEVEAYRYPGDSANHCRAGRTARNAPMWGPPGHAYVYLCYGVHHMLNLVTNLTGEGAAVLIRAAEPVAGHALVRARRGGRDGPIALAGPGKVAAVLALDASWSGHCLYRGGGLVVLDAPPPRVIVAGPRVGIDYASARDRRAPWRLADGESAHVSSRASLRPVRRARDAPGA